MFHSELPHVLPLELMFALQAALDTPPPPGLEWWEIVTLIFLGGAFFGGFYYYFVSARARVDSLPRRFWKWLKLIWDVILSS